MILYFLSSDESYSSEDESENDGSESRSSGTYAFCDFYLCLDNSVGSVSSLGSGVFAPTGIESKCDILHLTCLYQYELSPKVVNS